MWAGIVSAQIGGNPTSFNYGTKYPNATHEGDTISVNSKIPIMNNDQVVNYFANVSDILAMGISGLTPNRALISDGSGDLSVSAVTTTELSYVSGVTSALQAQINDLVPESRVISTGLHLTGGGTLEADRTLTLTPSVDNWVTDSQGQLRMFFGGTAAANAGTLRASNTGQIFSFRSSANATRFSVHADTGDGAFTGTVSGSDPVNNDDFVTKGYAESNFAAVTSGTFTPTLIDSGGGATYSGTFTGQYVKIGPLVTIILSFVGIGTTGTPTGALEIGNLPYTVSLASSGSVSEMFGGNVNFYSISAQSVPTVTNRIRFVIQQALDSSLASNMAVVTFTSGQIRTTISYRTND